MRTPWASRFTYRWGAGSRESFGSAVRVLDFTCIFDVVFYNRGDRAIHGNSRALGDRWAGFLPLIPIPSGLFPFLP
jgi:hypothetical protein